MFKLIQDNPTFKAKVGISVAGQDKKPQITVEFRYLTRDKLDEYFANLAGKTDATGLAEIVVGWEGVDQPFSTDALSQLLSNYPAAAWDFFEAFRRELIEAKQGN